MMACASAFVVEMSVGQKSRLLVRRAFLPGNSGAAFGEGWNGPVPPPNR
jgi:hypothetical protein